LLLIVSVALVMPAPYDAIRNAAAPPACRFRGRPDRPPGILPLFRAANHMPDLKTI
jgi:hypothetical protein